MTADLEHAPGRGRLAGKTALVAGGGSIGPGWGNGKAAAVLYAREGAKVAVVDWREDAARETADIIAKAGGQAIALTGDLTSESDVARIVAEMIAAFGRIDILHNNVGGSGTGKHLGNMTLEDWNATLARNVTAAMLTCRAVVLQMEQQGGGSIINISSISSIRHLNTPTAVYSAAKGALNELTKNIALHYAGKGIRANCVLPGYIDTPFIRRDIGGKPSYAYKGYASAEEYAAVRHKVIPMGRMGTGWDVAYAALYFASDESAYTTGQMLVVDGGVTSTAPGV
ncbi:MAG: SDR family oxidoreductase [Alphaproteobacteria bacterium]|nr:SDR family oxidoreductase [Alphaproteobacteria bacterium]